MRKEGNERAAAHSPPQPHGSVEAGGSGPAADGVQWAPILRIEQGGCCSRCRVGARWRATSGPSRRHKPRDLVGRTLAPLPESALRSNPVRSESGPSARPRCSPAAAGPRGWRPPASVPAGKRGETACGWACHVAPPGTGDWAAPMGPNRGAGHGLHMAS
eukprot:scaffold597_cov242-Prasinococcus_capsulatus_cf.AAC.2